MVQLLEGIYLVVETYGEQILSLQPTTLHTHRVERTLCAIYIVGKRADLKDLLRTALGLYLTQQLAQDCDIFLADNTRLLVLYRDKILDNNTTGSAISQSEICLLDLNT